MVNFVAYYYLTIGNKALTMRATFRLHLFLFPLERCRSNEGRLMLLRARCATTQYSVRVPVR